MIITWTEAGFNYYLLSMMVKYLPGDIFLNNYVASAAEIASYIASGLLVKHLNIRRTFWFSHVLAFAGMLLMAII